jgi:HlyD family secretion protein
MDRALSEDYLKQRKRKNLIRIVITILILVAVFFIINKNITKSVSYASLHLSTADIGMIENSFSSGGIIEPFYEEVVSAKTSTEVVKINTQAGQHVTPESILVELNTQKLQDELARMDNSISLHKNSIERNKEDLKRKERDLYNNLIMDSIRRDQLKANLEREKYLFEIGGGSQQKVDIAETEYKLATLKRENQISDFESFKNILRLDIQAKQIELEKMLLDRKQISKAIDEAQIKTTISGIVTAIMVEPGQFVNAGQQVVQVADPNQFKIEGSISTRYADKIYPGQKAIIQIHDSLLSAVIHSISPSIDNGAINFIARPDNPSHPSLKAKMRVEVRIIRSENPKAIRIHNADFYYGSGEAELFVLAGDFLEKRTVQLGGANFDYVEVLSGINPGEEVVISKSFTEKHNHYERIRCKK